MHTSVLHFPSITLIWAMIGAGYAPLLHAQSTFEATYGGSNNELGFGVEQTSDGGYILAGVTYSEGSGSGDMWLVRTDEAGALQWSRTFGTVALDIGYAVRQTTDGGFVLCGTFNGFSNDTLTLVRTDAAGSTLWVQHYPGSLGRDLGYALQQTTDGGFVVCGSSGPTLNDAYIVRTDAQGTQLWSTTLDLGGNEMATAVQPTPDNGALVLVRNSGFADPDGELYLLRLDPDGDTLWTRQYSTPGVDEARGLTLTSDGGCLIAGSNGYPVRDIQLIRTDAQGEELWRRMIGTAGDEVAHDVRELPDGGFAVAGAQESAGSADAAMYLLRTDADGYGQWERTYPRGIRSEALALDLTSDEGFILLGSTFVQDGPSTQADLFLVKTDGSGLSAVEEQAHGNVLLGLYPNPARDLVRLEMAGGMSGTLHAMDATGRVVWQQFIAASEALLLDVGTWPAGTYVLQLSTGEGWRSWQRLVVTD